MIILGRSYLNISEGSRKLRELVFSGFFFPLSSDRESLLEEETILLLSSSIIPPLLTN